MGWSHSVHVDQSIQEKMIKELGFDQEQAVQKGGILIEPFRWGVFIDDYFGMGVVSCLALRHALVTCSVPRYVFVKCVRVSCRVSSKLWCI